MGARGGPCPGGGTLLRAGWQEASRSSTGTLSPSRSEVADRGSLQGPAYSGQKNTKASSQAPGPRALAHTHTHTHTHTVHGAGALRVPVQASRGGGGPCPVQPGCRQAVLGADTALVWFHVQWSLRRKAVRFSL